MKENVIKFLYAVDCYLLYLLSGVVAAGGVVAYYSISAAKDYGNIGDVPDSSAFVEYIADFVAGKSSVVLLVSYVLVILSVLLFFAIRRKGLAAYAGMTYARFSGIISALALGAVLNVITYSLTPNTAENAVEINAVLVLCIILGPFVEELMFRGVLLKMFASSCGIFAASVITSVLFAVSHTDPIQMLYSFVLGIILCLVRVKSTSFWSALSLHLSFNITGAVMMIQNPSLSNRELVGFFAASAVLIFIACIGGRRPARKISREG